MQSKFKWLMASILVVSILIFYATRDVIPDKLILSTGQPGGFYHQVGTELKLAWEKQTQQQLELLTSSGSQENFTALKESKADFALIQGGVVNLDGLNIIAPLSTDLIHVIVRKESSISAISDLKGKSILIGMSGSGMAASALKILQFHGLDETNTNLKNAYFTGLDENQNMDAAIVTAGILNSDLVELLESGNYRIIPIEYAQAFCEKNAFFSPTVIHKGLYRMGDSLLTHDIPTVATPALLVGREELGHEVVDQILQASFEKASYMQSPVMLNRILTATASSLRRSSKLITGGSLKPRTLRPVRTRVVSTYLRTTNQKQLAATRNPTQQNDATTFGNPSPSRLAIRVDVRVQDLVDVQVGRLLGIRRIPSHPTANATGQLTALPAHNQAEDKSSPARTPPSPKAPKSADPL